MRDILIVLGMCLAAIILGAWLFFHGPIAFTQMREDQQAAPVGADAKPEPEVTADISFKVLDSGTNAAGVTERKNFGVYDATEFARLWKMAHGTDGKTLPKVDFLKEYVIGVFAGTKPTGGYAISVDKVTETGDTRTIGITLTKPGAGCLATQALTSPYQIVVVPFSDAELAPDEATVETPCP